MISKYLYPLPDMRAEVTDTTVKPFRNPDLFRLVVAWY